MIYNPGIIYLKNNLWDKKNKIFPGHLYFLTLTVVDWVDIFTRPVYKHIIVDSLKYCQAQKGLVVYAWCLMSNHLHLIATNQEGFHLSDILRDFKKFTSKQILHITGRHEVFVKM